MRLMHCFFSRESLVVLMLGVIFAPTPAPAAERTQYLSFLKSLSGTWKGRGHLRRSLTANKEPVSCRLDGSFDGSKLDMAYICLGIDVRFESTGTLFYEATTHQYAGTWYTTGQNWKTRVRGTKKGNTLNLTLFGQHPKTAKPMQSQLYISLDRAGKLVNSVRTRDPKTGRGFEVFAVTFKR